LIEFAAVVIGSYLIGSIPFGLVLGKLKGVDIREYGSGNIGSTNVLRTVGPWAGVVVLICDVLKGVAAVFIARYTIGSHAGEMAAGFAAVAGHDWSIFIRFRGGRGVATSAGGLFVMAPLAAVGGIAIFVLVIALTRYVSLGSIVGSSTGVVIVGALLGLDRVPAEYLIYTGVVVALIIFQHRENVSRLLAGNEHKFGQKGEKKQTL
jgi:glycerol-3-phosphate acyltransferase PlsY